MCPKRFRAFKRRSAIFASIIFIALSFITYSVTRVGHAQTSVEQNIKPDTRRALAGRTNIADSSSRPNGHVPSRSKAALQSRPQKSSAGINTSLRQPARVPVLETANSQSRDDRQALQTPGAPIHAGTPLSRVLHTSQLSLTSSAGTDEEYVDRTNDLVADDRTTFDSSGGSFDIALGRSGTRYEVYSGVLGNVNIGVLVVASDTNGDYVRDSSATYDLHRDFNLPSAAAVVSGTSNAGREFVIVSSSGFYGGPGNPDNEPTAGVVLLVRDPATGGFDPTRSRELVRVGDNQLNNANALALLPNNNLLIADFDSDELRVVRDTNADGIPDTLDPVSYYQYQFSNDAPLDIAVNSRGVVFSHSVGNNTVMLAIYDTNNDGRADTDEVCVEGLSIDNALFFHGLTVDRAGTVYVIEDASGAADRISDGGNLGTPRIDAFPDPALNGILRDGAIFAVADNANTQALSGLSFGIETALGTVGHLTATNSASLRGNPTFDGLATIQGTGLTRGLSGRTEVEAAARGVSVTVEGRTARVLSFNDTQVHVYIPAATGAGPRSIVVSVGGDVIAADDVAVTTANPGLFTTTQTGAGEAVALLTSGFRYTISPFPATTGGQPSVIAIFGTGWRNSLPVTVRIGGQTATVQYAGPAGAFPGLDQINVALPSGVTGTQPVIVTTANGATSRNDAVVSVQ